jgi:hypothetical protein
MKCLPCLVGEGMVVKPLVRQHESKDNESERGIGVHFVHFVCGIATHELVLLELNDVIRSGSYGGDVKTPRADMSMT